MDGLLDFQLTQSERMISVESCDLGVQKIVAISFDGVEELSTLSKFRVELVSLGRALKPSEMLGHRLGLALRVRNQVRKFNGIISRFEALGSEIRGHHLHVVELVPPAWLLTLNQRYRIFHDKKYSEVIQTVLSENGLDFSIKSIGEQREYWVQYCESDFNFVSRLWEEEGLFYRFDHASANCTLEVGNGSADYVKGDPETLELGAATLDAWQEDYRIGPSAYKHTAWDYKAVSLMDGSVKGLTKAQPSGLPPRQVFEYSARHQTDGEGTRLATVRMEEREAALVWINGASEDCRMQTGAKYKVKNHTVDLPGSGSSDSYLAVRVTHHTRDNSLLPFDGGRSYSNEFVCIPADFEFRPPRVTPRPYIQGPQTATVTDTPDDQGRAQVKFHWETETSRWCRVAQNWAYNQMGTQFLPRVDSEVVVEFLNGDPDYPIIVGMVYNGKNKLPFDVPGNKTQSGIRGANWGDAGTADVSNEIRFEDKAGEEEIYTHAQKDYRRVVKHDDNLTVETGNRTLVIQQGNVTETLNQGNHALKVDLGKASVDAMQSITLTVGQNSITINQQGITLKGLMISIQGTIQVEAKAPLITVNADGILTLKGGVTFIN